MAIKRPYTYDDAYDIALKCVRKCGSQADFADMIGVSEATVSRWLQRGRLPKPKYMFMMYKILGMEDRVPAKLLKAQILDEENRNLALMDTVKADGRKTPVFNMGMDLVGAAVIRCGGVINLSRRTGLSKSALYQWLRRSRFPSWTQMAVLLNFMGATLTCPLTDDTDNSVKPVEPVESVEPVEPVEAVDVVEVVDAVEPVEVESVEPSQRMEYRFMGLDRDDTDNSEGVGDEWFFDLGSESEGMEGRKVLSRGMVW